MVSSFNKAVKPITGIDPNGLQIKIKLFKINEVKPRGVTFYVSEYGDVWALYVYFSSIPLYDKV